jgi:hypothetical protein
MMSWHDLRMMGNVPNDQAAVPGIHGPEDRRAHVYLRKGDSETKVPVEFGKSRVLTLDRGRVRYVRKEQK